MSLLQKRDIHRSLKVSVLTNINPEGVLNGSIDLEALAQLGNQLQNFELTHLPSLHAKIYIADQAMAIITSGNLTDSGISGNIEYGVVSVNEAVVREIRGDCDSYALLGARITLTEVMSLLEEIKELKGLFQKAQKTIRAQVRRAFKEKLESTQAQLLKHRAKGKTTNAILSQTIVYLLQRGPLKTTDLHPLIQRLHPDICDDSVDRIIGDVHFGKKWKHYVRNAQQFLKREGRIRFDGLRWHLVS
jgi:hypothetical protein